MTDSLRITTLGGLRIEHNDQPVTGLASRKADALLIYLIYTGRSHERESLATLLWDDRPSSRALGNLSVLLSSLRKHLAPYLTITRYWVSSNQENEIWLDVKEFESCLNNAIGESAPRKELSEEDVASLESATGLYKGDFLEGFYIRDSRGFEEWAFMEREHLQRLMLEALEALVGFYLRSGMYEKGIESARRELELDPLREETHRQLMMLLARSGQHNAALTQYKTCKRILGEDLGIEPAPKTRELYMRIRAAARGPRHNLPPQSTPLVGRESELAQIRDRLADPDCRLLTIVGPGGIGKTRLAVQAAERQVADFLNGVCLITLAAVNDPEYLVSAIADALKFSFSRGESTKQQLLDYLREKEILLLLDNFEHLLMGAGLLGEILHEAKEVKILVTSRERLNLQEEWVYALEGLAYPLIKSSGRIERQDIESLEKFSAVQLFLYNARKVHSSFSLVGEDQQGMSRVCQIVEGMPLGIELASSWVQVLSCREIAREIEGNLDFLTTTLRNLPPRHRNMRAVFDHSWHILSETERQVFRKLSVFKGGFTRDAASHVAGATLTILHSLVEKSLVRRSEVERYELHELLRQYGEGKINEYPGEKEAVLNYHCAYFAEFLHNQEANIFSSGQQQALKEITEEFDNIRAAMRWATDHVMVTELNKSCLTLWYFSEVRTRYQDSTDIGKRASEALRESGLAILKEKEAGRAYAWSYLFMGYGYMWHAQYEMAQEYLKVGLEVAETIGDDLLTAMMLNYLGLTAVFKREISARETLERGLEITNNLNLVWLKRFFVHNLGLEACNREDYEGAKKYFREQLRLCKDDAGPRTLAGSLKGLGDVAYALGNYDESWEFYEDAAEGFKAVDDNRLYADILSRMGDIACIKKDYTLAKETYLESLTILQGLGIRLLIISTLNHLGYAANALGEHEEALAYFREALKSAIEIHVPYLVLKALPGIAMHQAREGDTAAAVELLAFTIHHGATSPDTMERAKRILNELESDLPPQEVTAAQSRGKSKELEDVAEGLLVPNLKLSFRM